MFTRRFKLFDLLGFPIFVDLSWFIIVLLITWSLATNLFPYFYEGLPTATYWRMGLISLKVELEEGKGEITHHPLVRENEV